MSLIHRGHSLRTLGFLSLIWLGASAAQAQDAVVPAQTAPPSVTAPQPLPEPPVAPVNEVAPALLNVPAVPETPVASGAVAPAPDAPPVVPNDSTASPQPLQVAPTVTPMQDSAVVPLPGATALPENPAVAPVAVEQSADVAPVADPVADSAHGLHDLSPYGMYMAADWVVKAVMISLAVASVATWTIWLAKSLQLFGARSRANFGLRAIVKAQTLDEALGKMADRRGVVANMLRAAKREVMMSDAAIDHAGGGGVKERVASSLGRMEASAGRTMSKGTGVLASIGSTAPFVGLFGTVWGIMNSFIGIAETQTTNLAVVAPGIAEALLATAIGLVAAIPAVIFYNAFAKSVTGYRQLVADAGAGIERLVSRDLDFRKHARRHLRDATAVAAE